MCSVSCTLSDDHTGPPRYIKLETVNMFLLEDGLTVSGLASNFNSTYTVYNGFLK